MNNRTTTSSSRTRTSTTRTTTSTSNSTKARLLEYYQVCLGIAPPSFVASQIEEWLAIVGEEVIRYALEETACAPRPSWRYAMAIIRSCEGIHIPPAREPGITIRERIEIGRSMLQYRQRRQTTDDSTQMPY